MNCMHTADLALRDYRPPNPLPISKDPPVRKSVNESGEAGEQDPLLRAAPTEEKGRNVLRRVGSATGARFRSISSGSLHECSRRALTPAPSPVHQERSPSHQRSETPYSFRLESDPSPQALPLRRRSSCDLTASPEREKFSWIRWLFPNLRSS